MKPPMPKANALTAKQRDSLLRTLKARFEAHMHRHASLEWTTVQARLEAKSATARCSAIAATTRSSCTTTAPNPTMPLEGSGARSEPSWTYAEDSVSCAS